MQAAHIDAMLSAMRIRQCPGELGAVSISACNLHRTSSGVVQWGRIHWQTQLESIEHMNRGFVSVFTHEIVSQLAR